uniref:Protein brambleberry n=1 Tax=Graphocephala atropunctata TaxID=36148 RepID=A0A1B6MTJ5_9HEMI
MIFLKHVPLTIILLFFNPSFASSFFGWFDQKSSNTDSLDTKRDQEQDLKVRDDISLISVPFEEMSVEDQFILEAERFSSVSPSGLDTCEHRVVLKIQTSCKDMNEEELAKLSIKLLNCQLEVSGRTQIACTDEMSLKACTSPMDDETWNAYHIINNRARSVCYAIRQQQFRVLSEMTVNKLMSSALQQVTNMESLKELQKEMNLLTAETMSSLKEGQRGLTDQNSGLQLAQRRMRDDIFSNIKQLAQEKILIQNTQSQLDTLSKKLIHQFGEAESRLETQSELHQQTHQQILSHLQDISLKADILWKHLEQKNGQILQLQEKVKKSTQETLENLSKINSRVNYLMNLVDQVKNEVDSNITWATAAVGGDMMILAAVLQQCLLLVGGLLVSLFLQLSVACRLSLLAAVLFNIVLIYYSRPLTLLSLSGTIVGLWAVSTLSPLCWLALQKYKTSSNKSLETFDEAEEEVDDKLSTKSSTRSESSSHSYNIIPNGFSNNLVNNGTSSSFLGLRNRISPSTCAAVCRNGQMCRSSITPGRRFCKRHISH